jgi:hypothetical protein
MKISHLSVRTLVLIGASAAVISFAGPADARDHKHSCGNAKICGGPIIIGGRTGTGLGLGHRCKRHCPPAKLPPIEIGIETLAEPFARSAT